jgi:hypothetical protein
VSTFTYSADRVSSAERAQISTMNHPFGHMNDAELVDLRMNLIRALCAVTREQMARVDDELMNEALMDWMQANGEPNPPGAPGRPPAGTAEELYADFAGTYNAEAVCDFTTFKNVLKAYWLQLWDAAPPPPCVRRRHIHHHS